MLANALYYCNSLTDDFLRTKDFIIYFLHFLIAICFAYYTVKMYNKIQRFIKQLLCVQDNGRSCQRRFSIKNVFLKISQNSQENTCARVSFWIKLQTSSCNFIKKETLTQVFSCTFCEIFKNTFFTEYLRVTTSTTGRQHFTAEKS